MAKRSCPFCKKKIHYQATVCPYCTREVEPIAYWQTDSGILSIVVIVLILTGLIGSLKNRSTKKTESNQSEFQSVDTITDEKRREVFATAFQETVNRNMEFNAVTIKATGFDNKILQVEGAVVNQGFIRGLLGHYPSVVSPTLLYICFGCLERHSRSL